MRLRKSLVPLCLALLLLPGCFSMHHTVGAGPIMQEEARDTQWWWLFGLMRMGEEPDSQMLAEGSGDYKITTEFTFNDVLISAIPSILGFYRQSIVVER